MGIAEEIHATTPPQELPKIEYKNTVDLDEQYMLQLNLMEIARLLKARGVPDDKIGTFKVEIIGGRAPDILQQAEAVYLFLNDSLTIFPKNIVSDYEKLTQLAEEIVGGKNTTLSEFNSLLETQRLGGYLQNEQSPKSRRIKFAMKLLWKGTQKKITPLIAHELQHKIDYEHTPTLFKFVLISEKLLPLLGLLVPKLAEHLIEIMTGTELELTEDTVAVYLFTAMMSMYFIQRYAYLYSYTEKSANALMQEVEDVGDAVILGKLGTNYKNKFLDEPWHQTKRE